VTVAYIFVAIQQ